MLDCIIRITAKSLVFVVFVPAYTNNDHFLNRRL